MATLVLAGGHVITPHEERFCKLSLDGEFIESVGQGKASARILDVSNCYVTPGLIDLQVNGSSSCDLWADPTETELLQLQKELMAEGVTSFLPTLITDSICHLKKNIAFLSKAGAGKIETDDTQKAGLVARMPGIHLEGPCLSPRRPGVHPKQHLAPLSAEILTEFVTHPVLLMTVAAELDPDGKAINYLQSRGLHVSLGHSDATMDEAELAFTRGVTLMTHTFNALPPIHHREPGAVTAALLNEAVSCCVIADGKHVDPPIIKLILKAKGASRVILVTDAAHIGTSRGGLVGSSITLSQAVRNIVGWGCCSFQEAIAMSTYNPAKAIGVEKRIGQLIEGALADLVVWEKETLSIRHVILGGQLVF